MNRTLETELTGTSRVMLELHREIERVADSDAKVLISGSSGVGKELVARTIHAASPRRNRPFVAVNCAGLPETLLESELFGHVKGSFTGAYRDKAGTFEQANGGTVFLDEVGEMSIRMQGLLLRFLETGELQKVGADSGATVVDVRVITATNRDLAAMVAEGQFREDLYYRLNVISLHVPLLREHAEDIPQLVEHFLVRLSPPGFTPPQVAPDALEALCAYRWPGNVRELQNIVERLIVSCRKRVIQIDDLPAEVRQPAPLARGTTHHIHHDVADELFRRMTEHKESFWALVYPRYMEREITRTELRNIVEKGLTATSGSYRILTRLFNMPPSDYKKFLNFLRKHKALVPFKDFRALAYSVGALLSCFWS